jgi:hypothetical protein
MYSSPRVLCSGVKRGGHRAHEGCTTWVGTTRAEEGFEYVPGDQCESQVQISKGCVRGGAFPCGY